MKKVTRRKVLGSMMAAAAYQSIGSAAPIRQKRPNILFALADDWSWPHASIAGDPVVKTPTFDRVCKEGVMFPNAHVTSPSCSPSRASMLTGQWHWRLGEGANLASTVPAKYPVYPDLLEAAGYHVGFAGKGWGPGDDTAGGRTRNPAGKEYKSFKEFMAARPAGAPFCFWFGSHDPHRPYKADQYKGSFQLDKMPVPPYLPDRPEVRADIADYYFAVERYDRETGEIVSHLEQSGELDDTLVVMAGDNGWSFPRCKANLYSMGTRVPLAVRWKGHSRTGVVEEQFVSLQDLAPTFLQAANLPIPTDVTGRSLQPLLSSPKKIAGREFILTGMERHMGARGVVPLGYPMRALRNHEWLYIRNYKPDRWPAGDPACKPMTDQQLLTASYGAYSDIDAGLTKTLMAQHSTDPDIQPHYQLAMGKRPAEELYHVTDDPNEMKNLAGDPRYQKLKTEMSAQLDKELRKAGDPRILRGEELDQLPLRHTPDFEQMRREAYEGCTTKP